MKKIRSSALLLTALIILIPVIVFAAVHLLENKYERLPLINKAADLNNTEYKFQNQNNETKSFTSWEKRILVVNYFFTACPSICPKMINTLKTAATEFKNDPKIQFLSFTVDPEHDSVAKLSHYIKTMGAEYSNWDFLTGDKRTLYKLARKQFFITATDGDGGPQDFIHSDKLVLLDKQHNIRGYYDGTNESEVEQLITDIKKIENEN